LKRPRSRFKSAGFLLGGALSSIEQANLLNYALMERKWADIVGERLARVSRPGELSRRNLLIWVKEPVWADSMSYLKTEIIEKINRVIGKSIVDSIKTVYKRDFEPATTPAAKAEPEEVDERVIPPEILASIEKTLEQTDDSELRAALKRVMLKSVMAKHPGK